MGAVGADGETWGRFSCPLNKKRYVGRRAFFVVFMELGCGAVPSTVPYSRTFVGSGYAQSGRQIAAPTRGAVPKVQPLTLQAPTPKSGRVEPHNERGFVPTEVRRNPTSQDGFGCGAVSSIDPSALRAPPL